jgi:hypothetical protein
MEKKFAYRLFWEARLLDRRTRPDAIPIDISTFKQIAGNIGIGGWHRSRKDDSENIRAYRKDSYGMMLVFIDFNEKTIEGKTEAWGGLMHICSDFGLRSYRSI